MIRKHINVAYTFCLTALAAAAAAASYKKAEQRNKLLDKSAKKYQ